MIYSTMPRNLVVTLRSYFPSVSVRFNELIESILISILLLTSTYLTKRIFSQQVNESTSALVFKCGSGATTSVRSSEPPLIPSFIPKSQRRRRSIISARKGRQQGKSLTGLRTQTGAPTTSTQDVSCVGARTLSSHTTGPRSLAWLPALLPLDYTTLHGVSAPPTQRNTWCMASCMT